MVSRIRRVRQRFLAKRGVSQTFQRRLREPSPATSVSFVRVRGNRHDSSKNKRRDVSVARDCVKPGR